MSMCACVQEMMKMFDFSQLVSLSKASADISRQLTILEWLATTVLKPHV